ncbi:hypothetical protein ACIGW8_05275 [Streptomyces sioyaensis]|uniref:hypothetical protein n=1 Tax=Streptomyces sioyaensis TaxID=67364 RepID=UPI0037D96205
MDFADDKPCFLITDGAGGPVTDLADGIEEMQLGIGEELLRHARAMHGDPKVPDREFRHLSRRLPRRWAMRCASPGTDLGPDKCHGEGGTVETVATCGRARS